MRIQQIHAKQLIDSRGNPTVEAEVITHYSLGTAIVPSGASTGAKEAHELRDEGISFNGKGVKKAVKNINSIINKELHFWNTDEQKDIDYKLIEMAGPNKKKLGANATLAVSMANTRAAAHSHKLHLFEYLNALYDGNSYSLPVPFANIINGGVHAGNSLQFQEFMIAPIKASSFSEATRAVAEIYHELKKIIEKEYGKESTSVGDEGGFAPKVDTPEEALDLIKKAIWGAGYKGKIGIAMDAAASEFYDAKTKTYEAVKGKKMSSDELADYYLDLIHKYDIISVEDPFDEEDFHAWRLFRKRTDIQVVADDLTVSNKEIIKQAVKENACNSLLLKINQIGTITEAMEAAQEAEKNKWTVMVSHRSGETEDSYIADLAVGIGCGQIKLGAPARGERTAKYNQLLRIEEYLGNKGKYAKWK